VRAIFAWHWHGYEIARKQFNLTSFNDRVEYECAACQSLAIVAMTAVDKHWFLQELVADGAARTAASDVLWHGRISWLIRVRNCDPRFTDDAI
jgi:hypothetical protein